MLKNLIIGIFCLQGLFGALSATDNGDDKEKVRQRLEDLSAALNQGKEEVFSSFWTEDGEFSRPVTGELLEGRAEITKFLQERSKEIKKRGLQFSFKPATIDFDDPNTAIVEGVSEISDKGALLQRNARRIELVKENGQWYIDVVSEIEVAPAPPVYLHLKGLEWLIGKWIDEDENVTNTFTTDWDKFKNFIIQRFKMEVYGVEGIEGIQIIGWDPADQKIRSWVYDSDGGFGNGVWSKNGAKWNAEMSYVLSDGKKASATFVYTPIDDKSYSFASTRRTIDGKALEDIEPITVVKEN